MLLQAARLVGRAGIGRGEGYRAARCYRGTRGGRMAWELLDGPRLRDYDATVVRANDRRGGLRAFAAMLDERGKRRLVVPAAAATVGVSLPEGFEFVTDDGADGGGAGQHSTGVVTGSRPWRSRRRGRLCCRMCRGREGGRRRWCRTITCAWCGVGMWWRRCRRRMARLAATAGWRLRLSQGLSATADHRDDADQGACMGRVSPDVILLWTNASRKMIRILVGEG